MPGSASTWAIMPPGPSLSSLEQTKEFTLRPEDFLSLCQRRYGLVFTLNLTGLPSLVIVGDVALAKRVFQDHQSFPAGLANRQTLVHVALGEQILMAQDGPRHKRVRQWVQNALTTAFKEQIGDICTTIEWHLARWPTGVRVLLAEKLQSLIMDIACVLVIGGRAPVVTRRLQHLIQSFQVRGEPPLVPNLSAFIPARQALLDALDPIIESRWSEGRLGRTDVLSQLVQPIDEPFSRAEVRDHVVSLLMAGFDTTGAVLAWAFHHVLADDQVVNRALPECWPIARTPESVIGHATPPYLDGIISETLRLHPVTPVVNRITARRLCLGEWRLPAGTMVCPSPYLLHRQGIKDPEKFVPDRDRPRVGLYAFGGGAHWCAGQSVAQPEMVLILASVLSRFVAKPGRRTTSPKRRGFVIVPESNVPVWLTLRRSYG